MKKRGWVKLLGFVLGLILLSCPNPTGNPTNGGEDSPDEGNPTTAPVHAALSVLFIDTDQDINQVGGTVSITKAADESDVSSYVLYWATDDTTTNGVIAIIPKTGSNLTYAIPADTDPSFHTHLIVKTKNSAGEMAAGVSCTLKDNSGADIADVSLGRTVGPSDLIDYATETGRIPITKDEAIEAVLRALVVTIISVGNIEFSEPIPEPVPDANNQIDYYHTISVPETSLNVESAYYYLSGSITLGAEIDIDAGWELDPDSGNPGTIHGTAAASGNIGLTNVNYSYDADLDKEGYEENCTIYTGIFAAELGAELGANITWKSIAVDDGAGGTVEISMSKMLSAIYNFGFDSVMGISMSTTGLPTDFCGKFLVTFKTKKNGIISASYDQSTSLEEQLLGVIPTDFIINVMIYDNGDVEQQEFNITPSDITAFISSLMAQ